MILKTMSMHIDQQKEQFSQAYVHAIATVAGFATYKSEVDDDSVDLGIAARGAKGSTRSPRLELQLKCSEAFVPKNGQISYPLKIKNYDDLRGDVLVPRLLVVLVVPGDLIQWTNQTEAELALRQCAYFVSLRGLPDTTNATTVTVHVPQANIFSAGALQSLMKKVADRMPL